MILKILILLAVIATTAGVTTLLVKNDPEVEKKEVSPVIENNTATGDDIQESPVLEEKEEVVVTPVATGKVIDLSGQGLTKAPENIFSKTSTEELNLSNNNLSGSLQAEVRHLQALKVLNLSTNKFTGVPAEVGQLKNLEVLNLSNNNLTGLPYELGNLSKLKLLDLRGNNYATQDLDVIKKSLPSFTVIKVD